MTHPSHKNPIVLMNTYSKKFTKGEQVIANFIIEHYSTIQFMTIAEISSAIGVSESSIIRFTQMLGYSGLREFKLACASHSFQQEDSVYFEDEIFSEDTIENMFKIYSKGIINNLEESLALIDFEQLDQIAQILNETNEVFLMGEGYSSSLARTFYLRLKTLVPSVHLSTDYFTISQDSYMISQHSFVFVISQSGNSNGLLAIQTANKLGGTTACLTANRTHEMYKESQYAIVAPNVFKKEATGYIATENTFKIILDTLYLYLEIKRNKKQNHEENFLDHFSRLYNRQD